MKRPLDIVLVEDNPGDVALTMEALRDPGLESVLDVYPDGATALEGLRERAARGRSPDLVLLDLNLPKKDGRELLQEIRNDPVLRLLPVVVTTTSRAGRDVQRAYELHANCYVSKAPELDRFLANVQAIVRFWSAVAMLPSRDGGDE